MFVTRVRRDCATLRAQLDLEEHVALWKTKLSIEQLLPADVKPFTPIGLASLLLTGLEQFGRDWFEATCRRAIF